MAKAKNSPTPKTPPRRPTKADLKKNAAAAAGLPTDDPPTQEELEAAQGRPPAAEPVAPPPAEPAPPPPEANGDRPPEPPAEPAAPPVAAAAEPDGAATLPPPFHYDANDSFVQVALEMTKDSGLPTRYRPVLAVYDTRTVDASEPSGYYKLGEVVLSSMADAAIDLCVAQMVANLGLDLSAWMSRIKTVRKYIGVDTASPIEAPACLTFAYAMRRPDAPLPQAQAQVLQSENERLTIIGEINATQPTLGDAQFFKMVYPDTPQAAGLTQPARDQDLVNRSLEELRSIRDQTVGLVEVLSRRKLPDEQTLQRHTARNPQSPEEVARRIAAEDGVGVSVK